MAIPGSFEPGPLPEHVFYLVLFQLVNGWTALSELHTYGRKTC